MDTYYCLFKFKSALPSAEWEKIEIDGPSVLCWKLQDRIISEYLVKKFGPHDEVEIQDAQSRKVYDVGDVIASHSVLIVKRVPPIPRERLWRK